MPPLRQLLWSTMCGLKGKTAVALIVCAIVPLGVGTLVSGRLSEDALRLEVTEKLDRAAAINLSTFVDELRFAIGDLTIFGSSNVMQDVLIGDDIGAIDAALVEFLGHDAKFARMAVFDIDGQSIASRGTANGDLKNIADTDQFRAARTGITQIGHSGAATAGNDGTFILSSPIRAEYDPETIIGVLVGELNFSFFAQRLGAMQVAETPQDGEHILVLTDSTERVLYRTAAPDAEPVVTALLGETSDRSATSSGREAWPYITSMSAFADDSLPGSIGLTLRTIVAERAALAGAEELQRSLLITSGIVALVLIAATLIAVERIVLQPGYRLAEAMAGSKSGRAIPTDLVRRRDEIGHLTRTFASLMCQLSDARTKLIANSEAEIARRNAQLDAALNNMSQGLCLFDPEHRLIVRNPRFMEIFGLEPEQVTIGMTLEEVIDAIQAAGAYTMRESVALSHAFRSNVAAGNTASFFQSLPDGRSVIVSQVPMRTGGWVVTYSDVTEQRRAEAQMEHMAHHDALTSLPNRVKFRMELERALDIKGLDEFAVFCLDLDHFKPVNDTLGHPIGDKLLQAVGERLNRCIRDGDMVARLGGDEFAILQFGVKAAEEPALLAERIISKVCEPYIIDGHQIVIGTSIGIALTPRDGVDPDGLIKAADLALYRAKMDGRGICCFFEVEMDTRMQERRTLEIDLRKALINDEFRLCYQPIVGMDTNRVSCFEALIRWHHPVRGLVRPDHFIPLAEEIGIINQIGAWVLGQACRDAVGWAENIRVAVNLSPLQFKGMDVVSEVEAALSKSGLAAARLELEITETVLINETNSTLQILQRLRGLGVRISMDDFGTGYSSLSYLRKFPFDKIKIDRSFTRDLHDNPDAQAIVRAIAALGSSLGMCTTVEGVETHEQLAAVRAEGCSEVQGYFYSPPVPVEELEALLAKLHAGIVVPLPLSA